MKKTLTLLLGMLLLYSCSATSDGTTPTVVPVAPEELMSEAISSSAIDLMWTDRSTNETGFKIERKLVGGTFAVVGTTATDIATYRDTGLNPATTYIYRVYSYNVAGKSPVYSNELTLTTSALLPTVTTTNVSDITATSGTSGGIIVSDGGSPITARGVVWSTTPSPTIALSTKTIDGSGTGSFANAMTGLNATTTYYVRAYASNSAGTAYGAEISFTTPIILTITNGTQFWQNTNLNVTTYSDGTPIPQVTDPTQWANLTTGAWCYYNNDATNGTTYGKLYNWYAVAGIWNEASKTDANQRKKLAPSGYHVPSDSEWTTLTDYLGGADVAGGKMKESGITHWNSPNQEATNSSGFAGLPGGYRYYNGTFSSIGSNGNWWSSSEYTTPNAWYRNLNYYYGTASRKDTNKAVGFSVRCLRD